MKSEQILDPFTIEVVGRVLKKATNLEAWQLNQDCETTLAKVGWRYELEHSEEYFQDSGEGVEGYKAFIASASELEGTGYFLMIKLTSSSYGSLSDTVQVTLCRANIVNKMLFDIEILDD